MSILGRTPAIFKFDLGEKLRCTVSGFEGTATGRFEYLNGCVRYMLVPRVKESHEEPKELAFDEDQLERVEAKQDAVAPPRRTGGPRPTPSRTGLSA